MQYTCITASIGSAPLSLHYAGSSRLLCFRPRDPAAIPRSPTATLTLGLVIHLIRSAFDHPNPEGSGQAGAGLVLNVSARLQCRSFAGVIYVASMPTAEVVRS
ncbi:uncharacterized protein EI97DRAFT_437738 [Westerdykella ornata]|uniref:Uncharacterized protein n=1 Tax=Westerdykella ornata TaxID=318751 RepID=A0A6A6J5Q5_WESOR|nr:uncharacterized protein EI97DRAFT_437738 [Westerdykella ornata]KAF2271554.1 hypothetical protein EI97DRAFT_437738 [Westerdykella ornata]